jgi:excisionase family DNA binding protein
MLTIEDVAARLHCGRTTVFELIRSGELGASVKIGRRRLVDAANVDRYLQQLTST